MKKQLSRKETIKEKEEVKRQILKTDSYIHVEILVPTLDIEGDNKISPFTFVECRNSNAITSMLTNTLLDEIKESIRESTKNYDECEKVFGSCFLADKEKGELHITKPNDKKTEEMDDLADELKELKMVVEELLKEEKEGEKYEVIAILNAEETEEIRESFIKSIQDMIQETASEMVYETLGEKQLAYPIKEHKKGYFTSYKFVGSKELAEKVEKTLKESELVLKHIVVRV